MRPDQGWRWIWEAAKLGVTPLKKLPRFHWVGEYRIWRNRREGGMALYCNQNIRRAKGDSEHIIGSVEQIQGVGYWPDIKINEVLLSGVGFYLIK